MANQEAIEEGLFEEDEMRRREQAAMADLLATVTYHANRLPADSRVRRIFLRLAALLRQRHPLGPLQPRPVADPD